jgi:outer membrane protein TolC
MPRTVPIVVTLLLAASAQSAQTVSLQTASPSPLVLTLDTAIENAKHFAPQYTSAQTDFRVSQLDRSIARSALLPEAQYHNQYLYTQGGGAVGQGAVRFIANNAVHEYMSQANAVETLSFANIATYRRAGAAASLARARASIAERGLIATVITDFYMVVSAEQKFVAAERGVQEAQHFSDLTAKLEQGREVAHADVLKAQLSQQQRVRDLDDARLAVERAKLDLAVLALPDVTTNYEPQAATTVPELPRREQYEAEARQNNPELNSALAALEVAKNEVAVARGEYVPELVLGSSYGIDAPQFATDANGLRFLGYSAVATIDIPVWNWLATHDRVKQARLRQGQAAVELTAAQRSFIARLRSTYDEAEIARSALLSLQESQKTADESLRLTLLRYQAGEATALEAVDAQSAVVAAAVASADAGLRYRSALAQLQTLTGVMP